MRFRQSLLSIAMLLAALPCACAQQVVGDVYATDASVKGSVMLVGGGTRLLSGSAVTAGSAPAVVKLERGGAVRVCANTSISIATSKGGRDLLLGMSTGAIETHYDLGATTDSILTPDFRIQVPGPGSFHFALGADARGNTCIRSLLSNTASVIVTELMGDGTYQVKPGERVRFAGGQLAKTSTDAGDCGCPAPAPPVLKAAALPPEPPAKVESAVVAQAIAPAEAKLMEPPPPVPAGQVHVEVDAPFTFSAAEPEPPPAQPMIVRMNVSSLPAIPLPTVTPPPPPPVSAPAQQAAQEKPKKRGFFGKLRGLFSSMFGG